ncbi:hypothetical protein ACFQ3R_06875 [Mesonia ostreae]|uniref:Uncharacterized protein n=1 Tax=Mesonia ostreae TaxID=861110 RepID=A0ABU2KLR4_9FLAO|nr:hypothetical protein [Mesonia ostreae]MDT0295670.1 hypothetical protein [Mesonia ostreae]
MEIAIYLLFGILGAVIPYGLTRELAVEPVKASALPSLILALGFYFFPQIVSENLNFHIPVIFFGASFVGMVSKKILPYYLEVALAGILFSMLYLNASSFFNGYGGGLGTPACISVLSIYGLKKVKTLVRFFSVKKNSDAKN